MREKDFGLYMQDATLGNFARNTSASVEKRGRVSGKRASAARRRALKNIKLAEARCVREGINGAASREWLTDNWYIAEREGIGRDGTVMVPSALPESAYYALLTANFYVREAFAFANELLLGVDWDL